MSKTNSVSFFKVVVLATLCLINAVVQLRAATFNFTYGDVLIGFRKVLQSPLGGDGGGTNLVVDAGAISYFTNLAPNTKVTIGTFTGAQLSQVGTNNIGWSAFAYFDGAPAANTIFLTSPRASLSTQSASNTCPTGSANSYTIGQMSAILQGAVDNGSFSALNSSSAILEADGYTYALGADVSYYLGVGPNLDFNGTFQYNFEKYTTANFIAAGNPVRADFYWYYPAAIHTTPTAFYLGYFELGTNGVMTYTAFPSGGTVTTPVITSFSRTNTTCYVKFTTGSSGTYTLRGTNSAGLATVRTNWPAIASVGGNGSVNTLTDSTTSSNKFYVITAQ